MRGVKHLILTAGATLGLSLGTVLASSLPASAADGDPNNQVYEAVKQLEESNLAILGDGEVQLEDKLLEALEGTSVGVVVIPRGSTMESYDKLAENISEEAYRPYENFAEAVYDKAEGEGYRTILVLSKNHSTVASNGGITEIEGDTSATDAENVEAILLEADRWDDINEVTFSEWAPWVLGPVAILAGIMLLLLLAHGWSRVREKFSHLSHKAQKRRSERLKQAEVKAAAERQARAEAARRRKDSIVQELSKDIPPDLRAQLDSIQNWAAKHIAEKDKAFAQEIRVVVDRFQILFQRIEERGLEQQKGVAMVEYRDMLNKLSSALSERYYLDILAHPDLWDDPEGRIEQVKKAVAGTKHQLLENIKQVNAARDLDFQVALESLAGFMDRPQVQDLYRDDEGK